MNDIVGVCPIFEKNVDTSKNPLLNKPLLSAIFLHRTVNKYFHTLIFSEIIHRIMDT